MEPKNPREPEKREYFPPKIVHTEKLTALATTCVMADATCNPGPIQS